MHLFGTFCILTMIHDARCLGPYVHSVYDHLMGVVFLLLRVLIETILTELMRRINQLSFGHSPVIDIQSHRSSDWTKYASEKISYGLNWINLVQSQCRILVEFP